MRELKNALASKKTGSSQDDVYESNSKYYCLPLIRKLSGKVSLFYEREIGIPENTVLIIKTITRY